MKKIRLMLLTALAISAACTREIEEIPLTIEEQTLMTKLVGGTQGEHEAGALLIKVDSELAAEIGNGMELMSDGEKITMSPALGIRPKNMETARKYGLDRWFHVRFDASKPLDRMAMKLALNPSVESIQYNSFLEPVVSETVMPFIPHPATKSADEVAGMPFDDPYSSYQWNLYNDGSIASDAVAGADVGVKDAWRLTGGDPGVIVAVMDCAIAYRHEDLADAVWKNDAEIEGKENTDDDGNGFIDDKYGFNFARCYSINQESIDEMLDGKTHPALDSEPLNSNGGIGHGTHVAGIIGATNGNGKGVSSIAGGTGNGDGVRLMSCQIFDGTAAASDAQSAAAFIYAADNGACIAQCSYGNQYMITDDDMYINGGDLDVSGESKPIKIQGSPLETAALLYFLDPANSNHESLEGNMAIFAAGNHSNPYSIYPGALPYVLSVTAFGYDWLPGGYSNYGPGCDISAPGGEWKGKIGEYSGMILSTGLKVSVDGGYPGLETEKGRSNNYVYMQGTSMACPHVSGVVALGISYAKKLGKKFTRKDFTSMLLTSVNDIDRHNSGGHRGFYPPFSSAATDIDMNRYKGKMGTGAVDAWKFLMAIEGTPSVMVKTGEKAVIDLDGFMGEGVARKLECKVSADSETMAALGLDEIPVIKDGKLELTCTALGSGKITISSAVGKDPDGSIGEIAFSREISIVSRPYAASNGGWF